MALPSGNYDTATITNPSSAITDFVLLIDLSRLTDTFKSDWNTSSQGYGRAAKADGTELACDWINLDHTAKTGYLRVKWTGTLASTGLQRLRIYPPNTGNTQYAVGDTYGQYATYTGSIAEWPFLTGTTERAKGTYDDLTVSEAVLQANGGYIFDGANDYLIEGANRIAPTQYQSGFTVSFLMNADGYGGGNYGRVLSKRNGGVSTSGFAIYMNQPTSAIRLGVNGGAEIDKSITIGSLVHIVFTVSSDALVTGYQNGVAGTPGSTNALSGITTNNAMYFGNTSDLIRGFDGLIKYIRILYGDKSSAWVTEEYTQLLDQSTFWGSWETINPKKKRYFYKSLKGDQ